jgi:hypothetical protein
MDVKDQKIPQMFPVEEQANILCDLFFGAGYFDAVDIQFIPEDQEEVSSLEKSEQSTDKEKTYEDVPEFQFDTSLHLPGFGLFLLASEVQWFGNKDVCLVSERG